MEFVTWETHYEKMCREVNTKYPYDFYLQKVVEYLKKESIFTGNIILDKFLVICELEWLTKGKPYYNVHSQIIQPALRMNLKGITCNMLTMPRNLKVVNIRFSKDQKIKGILACFDKPTNRLILMGDMKEKRLVSILRLDSEDPIEDKIYDKGSMAGYEADPEEFKMMVKLFAFIKFLADSPDENLMEYDVCKKNHGEYVNPKTTSKRRHELVMKAKKAGKNGWNIGTKQIVIMNCHRLSPETDSDGARKYEQKWAHIRTGHLHLVRFGPGKKHAKVMWFCPLVVNPEKPFKNI